MNATDPPDDRLSGFAEIIGPLRAGDLSGRLAATGWQLLVERLRDEQVTVPERTTGVPVQGWLDDLAPTLAAALATRKRVVHVVEQGLALADLAALDFASGTEGAMGPSTALMLLVGGADEQGYLPLTAQVHPDMPVRGAVGWAIHHATGVGLYVHDLLAQWDAVGLVHEGWLYAAAGLTPTEAAAGLADESLDAATARALAALRGARLPVG